LFGPYLVTVELASVLLLAALVGALHLAEKWDWGQASMIPLDHAIILSIALLAIGILGLLVRRNRFVYADVSRDHAKCCLAGFRRRRLAVGAG